MPEVLEVCLTAQFLDHKLKNTQLTTIQVLKGRYTRHTLHGLDFFNNNKPFTISKVDSKGKFMWFELVNNSGTKCYILSRFGLSGQWDMTEREHSGIKFTIQDGKHIYNIYYTDPRNFGTLSISNTATSIQKELDKMGPDLLKESYTNTEFHNRIKKYLVKKDGTISMTKGDKEIVKILMDQSASGGLGSGIGNYLVSSILYEAKISPYKKIIDIYNDRKLSDKLAYTIKYIIKLAYMTEDIGYMEHIDQHMGQFINGTRDDIKKNQNHPFNFHPDVTIGKEKFEFAVYRKKKDPLGNDVVGDEIVKGRTTYWSPKVQK